jgi:hypothetical protein
MLRAACVAEYVVSSFRLLPGVLLALVSFQPLLADDARLVNGLRIAAGLPALAEDARLAEAARLHAAYLDRNRPPHEAPAGVSAHLQLAGDEGFSGATPDQRALGAGYPHRVVRENLSIGYPDAESAMRDLMGAIYHRLTFLDLAADQLGVAVGARSRVYLLGRSDLEALCLDPPDTALYRRPLDCLGRAMTRAAYEGLCAELPEDALYQPSHPIACPNGQRLDGAFMDRLCAEPPAAARFRGHGSYYVPCVNGTRIDGPWFDRLCAEPPPGAVYAASGAYYLVCDDERRVHAEWLEGTCAALPDSALYLDSGRYRLPCAGDAEVRVEYLDALDRARLQTLPEVILWPPDGADEVPPAFFIEEPDPLPDLEVSGYPVSVQFNPAFAARVEVEDYGLYRRTDEGEQALAPLRLLDADSDPHGLLDGHSFALFPLDRLAWGADYRARFDVRVDGEPRRLEWTFSTRGKGLRVLQADTGHSRFALRSGVDYLLYLPPHADRPHTVLDLRLSHLRSTRVHTQVLDPNTLRVRLEAVQCDRVGLSFSEGRRVELIPAGCPG